MKKSLIWLALLAFAAFAQKTAPYYAPEPEYDEEYDDDDEEEEDEDEDDEPMSLAQALSGSLSKSCVDDFKSILGKSSFSMTKFASELLPAVAKTKLQLKSPFGKPKDNEMTSAGLTVGCIKTLPESPAEIQSLLKNISLKAGLGFVESSIPANVASAAKGGSGDGTFKTAMSVSLISGGLGSFIYGIMQNGEVKDSVAKKNGKAAVDAEKSRNMSYGIGSALLAGGLVITVFF